MRIRKQTLELGIVGSKPLLWSILTIWIWTMGLMRPALEGLVGRLINSSVQSTYDSAWYIVSAKCQQWLFHLTLAVSLWGNNYFLDLFFFWLYHAAWGILVLRPGIETTPPALEARSLNHWTAREVPIFSILKTGKWGAEKLHSC